MSDEGTKRPNETTDDDTTSLPKRLKLDDDIPAPLAHALKDTPHTDAPTTNTSDTTTPADETKGDEARTLEHEATNEESTEKAVEAVVDTEKANDNEQSDADNTKSTNDDALANHTPGFTNEQLVMALTQSIPVDKADETNEKSQEPTKDANDVPKPADEQQETAQVTTKDQLNVEPQPEPVPTETDTASVAKPLDEPLKHDHSAMDTVDTMDTMDARESSLPPKEEEVPPPPTIDEPVSSNADNGALPELGAALRRLSNMDLPASSKDGDAEIILGNALAAVAKSQRDSPQATAMAIGNLAAITANISHLLNNNNNNTENDERRASTSSPAAINTTTQPIPDAAPRIEPTREKTTSPHAPHANAPETIETKKATPSSSSPSSSSPSSALPAVIIKNDRVWQAVQGKKEPFLGFYLYEPSMLLPNLESHLNGLVHVRIPARYLTYQNPNVKKRALWGSGIYTDDSDIVAMIIHSGKYVPVFQEPDVSPEDPFMCAVEGKAPPAKPVHAKAYLQPRQKDATVPDYDVQVTLRVLPKLQQYADSIQHHIKSRRWGKNHSGVSFYVESVDKIKKGDARQGGRSSLKRNLFGYERYRRLALGLDAPSV